MNCNTSATSTQNFLLQKVPTSYTVLCYNYSILLSILACSRMCQNGGTLDGGTCLCSCAGGFSGANCESECIMRYMCEPIKLAENVLVSECKQIL